MRYALLHYTVQCRTSFAYSISLPRHHPKIYILTFLSISILIHTKTHSNLYVCVWVFVKVYWDLFVRYYYKTIHQKYCLINRMSLLWKLNIFWRAGIRYRVFIFRTMSVDGIYLCEPMANTFPKNVFIQIEVNLSNLKLKFSKFNHCW